MAEETAVIDAGTAPVESAPVETGPTDINSVSTETTTTNTETIADPNDPMAALEAAMAAELPADEQVQTQEGTQTSEIPAEFAPALQISPFVTDANTLQQAVAAADQVWKVASGQNPASSLLEGMRAANPQGFQAVVENLVPYLEQVTGRKFTDQPATPPDPNQARLDALEAQVKADQQARQDAMWNQQVNAAREKAVSFLTEKSKGTFVEGMEQTVLQMVGAKAGIPENQMVEMLLQGKTEKLEAAYKAVTKDLAGLVKQMNANLIKKHRTLSNAVPAVKGAAPAKSTADFDAYLPGETAIQYATRQFNKGKQ